MSQHLPYWLALMYTNVPPYKIFTWLTVFKTVKELCDAGEEAWRSIDISRTHFAKIKKLPWDNVTRDLNWQKNGLNRMIVDYDDPDYPLLLKEIDEPPLVLFIEGNHQALLQKQIAVIGSRSPTYDGLQTAKFFSSELAYAGLTITSGMARGIDGASHQGALDARGFTVAVLGNGLNCLYPRNHEKLRREILAKEGALVSEYPIDMPPLAMNFPRRNRIIAGLCLGVLVVEAALKSGSLITANLAAKYGREVFAIPNNIHRLTAKGCHALIKQGAQLVESPGEVLAELGWRRPLKNETDTLPEIALSSEETNVLTQIDYEITPMDVIILRSQLTGGEVSSILLRLELQGLVLSMPGGYVRIAAKSNTT